MLAVIILQEYILLMSAEPVTELESQFTEPLPTLVVSLRIETAWYDLYKRAMADPTLTHVYMEGAKAVTSGRLLSRDFTGCSGLVLQQQGEGGTAALFHLVGNLFSEDQQGVLDGFDRHEPTTIFFISGGAYAYDAGEVEDYVLGYFSHPDNVQMKANYDDVGSQFHLEYDSDERRLYLHAYGGGGSNIYPRQGAHIVAYDI